MIDDVVKVSTSLTHLALRGEAQARHGYATMVLRHAASVGHPDLARFVADEALWRGVVAEMADAERPREASMQQPAQVSPKHTTRAEVLANIELTLRTSLGAPDMAAMVEHGEFQEAIAAIEAHAWTAGVQAATAGEVLRVLRSIG